MAGMPESKYKSHNTNKCKDKEQWKAKLSGNTADRTEAISSRTKDWKKAAKSESCKLESTDAYIRELRSQLKKKSYRKESRVQEKPKKRKRCVVVVVVGKRLVYISLAIRTRWRLLVVLSINTLSPFC